MAFYYQRIPQGIFWSLSVLQNNSLRCILTCLHIALKSTEVLRARWTKEQESKKLNISDLPGLLSLSSFILATSHYLSFSGINADIFLHLCIKMSRKKITLLDCTLSHGQDYQYTFCSIPLTKSVYLTILFEIMD